MNIEGLDYNTQRERLVLPEYGREIQEMVDYAQTIADKEERQHCAETIVAIMSNFQLDIDWPYDISGATQIAHKPEPLDYPMTAIPVRHYGKMMFELFEKLKTMPEGEERDELVRQTANQMKRNLHQWSNGSTDDEKIASDLARFTDGKIQLDLDTFKFEHIDNSPSIQQTNSKRKRR